MMPQEFIDLYKRRSYLHFDSPFVHAGAACAYVERFRAGEKHSFLPFLGFTLSTTRIRREDQPNVPRRQRQLVLKSKKRDIKIASHHDAAIYSYYGMILGECYERRLVDLSLESIPTAFRKVGVSRCNIDHAKEVFDFIEINRPCVALGFDVEKFFDRLSHRVLRSAWAQIMGVERLPEDHYRVFQSLTRFCWVSRKNVYAEFGISDSNPKMENSDQPRTRICSAEEFRGRVRNNGLLQHNPYRDRGIPQGSPVSAVLSNIYMLRVDEVMHSWAAQIGGLYRRYCDDIVVVVPPDRVETTEFLFHGLIKQSDLTLNEKKTERVFFEAGSRGLALNGGVFPYLGFVFDGNIVRLRQSSIDRYYGKMRRGVRLAKKCQRKQAKRIAGVSLKTRKLFLKYSHLANSQRSGMPQNQRTNFITYGLRAAKIFESQEIRGQVRNHWKKLLKQINK